ncbi:MAG TPA: EAL domain-containing protein [Gammaproteobacteria bacterium]|jgi:diguanylate cyclase (GGDEF)-like protein|nr:EAL domain-containing protein [Gammaproteobacteria bacterium]
MTVFVPALWIAAGICLFAGIHFTLTGLPRSRDRVYLAFGILSLILSAYLMVKASLYHIDSFDTLRSTVRWQLALACLIYPTAIWFFCLYTELKRWYPWMLGGGLIFAVLLVINIFSPYSVLYQNIVPRPPLTLPWGEVIDDYFGAPSRYAWAYYSAVDATFLWAIWRSIAMWRAGARARAVPLIIYLLLQFVAILQLEYVANTNSRMVTFAAFTFVALVLLMSGALRRELQQRSEALAASLVKLKTESDRRHEVEANLRYLAYHDQLTELPNRLQLQERLDDALKQARDSGRFGALLQFDLDHFKTVNDSLGHNLGDRLLHMIGARISGAKLQSDCIARLGGDEFAVLISGLSADRDTARQQAGEAAAELARQLRAPFEIDNHDLVGSVSMGIAIFPDTASDVDSVLKQADLAVYSAKNEGRNTTVQFVDHMQDDVNRRLFLERGLRHALNRRELELHYQPQLDNHGQTIGAEALLRWRHPEYGYISPAEFIPIAEETGLIHILGGFVLQRACDTLQQWPATDGVAGRLSINISPWQLFAPDFVKTVTGTVNASGIDPRRLTLEITENAFLHDLEDVAAKIRLLDSMGIRFAIDDFGSGYTSLASLKKLPLRELKIDQAFIHEMTLEPRDRFIEAIITLAHHLDLYVIAEGVETAAQQTALAALRCDAFQGYLMSRPLAEPVFFGWLRQHPASFSEQVL